jgi:hypothetical protein
VKQPKIFGEHEPGTLEQLGEVAGAAPSAPLSWPTATA